MYLGVNPSIDKDCSPKIIAAHSIQRRKILANIADNGKIYCFRSIIRITLRFRFNQKVSVNSPLSKRSVRHITKKYFKK